LGVAACWILPRAQRQGQEMPEVILPGNTLA